ncbi:hypothetical protein GCM10017612_29120 [Novosphingobium resinovorum]|nr:hypothetical protein GCM10017612_29120 [Novosphingobium resinovorum]
MAYPGIEGKRSHIADRGKTGNRSVRSVVPAFGKLGFSQAFDSRRNRQKVAARGPAGRKGMTGKLIE